MGALLLGHDEGDAGAVRLQRRSPLPSSAVEHGQCGQRRGSATVSSHVPQLIRVPVNGVVVVQLNSAANRTYIINVHHVVLFYSLSKSYYGLLYNVSSLIQIS